MLTAQVESLAEGLEELKPLLPLHYAELSLHQFHGHPLDPDYQIYLSREAAGELLYVTLRDTGRLVGYFLGFIAPGLHYRSCLMLKMDIFYVVKHARGAQGGKLLFDKVEFEARRRGVDAWFVGSKEHASEHPDRLFLACGFEKSETYYCKWLED